MSSNSQNPNFTSSAFTHKIPRKKSGNPVYIHCKGLRPIYSQLENIASDLFDKLHKAM